jgi:hypothetical protein
MRVMVFHKAAADLDLDMSAPPTPEALAAFAAFYEAADLAAFMTPEELAAPREGERGKLGVA